MDDRSVLRRRFRTILAVPLPGLLRALLSGLLAALLVACGGPSPSPDASAAPPGSAPGRVTSPEEAIAAVKALEPRFASLGPPDPGLIGQAHWIAAEPVGDGYRVEVRVGWGDCPAGCIHEHRWVYAVGRDGRVELLGEAGDPVPAEVWRRLVEAASPAASPGS
ncbi:MAG TPA: hypothetical protein VNJ28_02915 [Candidatus Limnocylindrales bacterium]|nr:hypothetical protein [Candidatus Limnocylindrales bacterium]